MNYRMKYLLETNTMKSADFKSCLVLIVLLFIGATEIFGQDFPKPMDPPRLVNDYVGILSDSEFRTLELKLERYEDSTTNQVAVVIVNSTGDYDIGQYTIELGEKWGIGAQGRDNGILILAAIKDREVFISTGYGLEGAVTDAASSQIIRDYILPNFRTGEYYEGFDEATTIIIGLAEGEFKADSLRRTQTQQVSTKSLLKLLFPILFIIFFTFLRYRRMARNHLGSNAGFWAILALMMSSRGGRSGSGWNDFTGGSGTFGGGGGGFGGFGGGSFGGGGAGGSW